MENWSPQNYVESVNKKDWKGREEKNIACVCVQERNGQRSKVKHAIKIQSHYYEYNESLQNTFGIRRNSIRVAALSGLTNVLSVTNIHTDTAKVSV